MLVDQPELIKKTPICGGLKTETLRLILSQSEELERQAGDFFFFEGDLGDCLYLIRSGEATVQRTRDGQDFILARIGAGDCFGEMSLIDLQRRFASVRAETDCNVVRIPYSALMRLCRTDMEQYAMVMMNLGREISRRLRIAGERLFTYQQDLDQPCFDTELTV